MYDITNPFFSEDISPPISGEWEAKRRVSRAIQQLSEVLVTSSPDIQKMHGIAAQLEDTAAEFAGSPRLYGRLDWIKSGEHGSFGQVSHELNPLEGQANPVAPPINTWFEGDKALGRCTCGWVYEGPPGSVHGGFVAAIFDQFMGSAQSLGGQPGVTGYLHVSYLARTPLNTELQLEGEVVKVERRKTIVEARMWAGDTLTARCEALFVEPRKGIDALENQQREE